jgi:hypothetical protein
MECLTQSQAQEACSAMGGPGWTWPWKVKQRKLICILQDRGSHGEGFTRLKGMGARIWSGHQDSKEMGRRRGRY